MAAAGITPVTVLTGFLGSGKSTLLNRIVADPRYADSAVVVNEWGDTPIDHALIRAGGENVVMLAGGCICCRVAGEVVSTLRELHFQRAEGRVPHFSRVVHAAFGQRRKTLRNSLRAQFAGDAVDAALLSVSIDGIRRGETLTLAEFAALSVAIPESAGLPVA